MQAEVWIITHRNASCCHISGSQRYKWLLFWGGGGQGACNEHQQKRRRYQRPDNKPISHWKATRCLCNKCILASSFAVPHCSCIMSGIPANCHSDGLQLIGGGGRCTNLVYSSDQHERQWKNESTMKVHPDTDTRHRCIVLSLQMDPWADVRYFKGLCGPYMYPTPPAAAQANHQIRAHIDELQHLQQVKQQRLFVHKDKTIGLKSFLSLFGTHADGCALDAIKIRKSWKKYQCRNENIQML